MADSSIIFRLIGDTSSLDKAFRASQRTMKEVGESASSAGLRLAAGFTAPLAGLAFNAVKSAGALEQSSTAFKTLLGSTAAATDHLQQLRDFAATTPFEFKDLTDASVRMQALGFAGRDVIPILRTVGDAASSLGKGKEGVDRIVLALGQMKSKGVVSAQEINQLAESGVAAWEILARTLNVTVAEAMKMAEKRMISASVAVPAILAGMNQKFAGAMAAQSQTLLGQWSNFQDKVNFTLTDIGTSLAPIAKRMLEIGTSGLTMLQGLAAGFARLNPDVQQTAIGLTALVGTLPVLALGFGQVVQTAMQLRAAIGTGGLVGALPLVAAGSAAAAASLIIFRKEIGDITLAARDLVGLLPTMNLEFRRMKAELVPGKGVVFKEIETGAKAASFSVAGLAREALGMATGFQQASFASRLFSAALDNTTRRARDMKEALASISKPVQGVSGGLGIMDDPGAALRMGENAKQAAELRKQIDAMSAAQSQNIEVSRLATFQELVQMEALERMRASLRGAAAAVLEFNGYLRPHEIALASASSASLDLASAQYQTSLNFRLNAVGANTAQIATDAYRGTIQETEAIMRSFGKQGPIALQATENATRKALERMIELYNAGKATADQVRAIGQVYAEAVKDRRSGGNPIENLPKSNQKAKESLLQVSTAATDLGREIAKLAFEGGKFGDAMKKVGQDVGETLLRRVVERAMQPMLKLFDQLIDKAAKWALDMLSKHIPGILGGLGKVGTAIGGIFGGGASAAGSVAGGAASAGGSAAGSAIGGGASAAGSIGGAVGAAAGSSVTAMVGAVSGVVSAVSGIISNFQLAGIGKDTGRMEELLRGLLNVVGQNGSESIHHFAKQTMFATVGHRDYWQTTGHTMLVKMSSSLEIMAANMARGMTPATAGTGSVTFQGGMFLADQRDLYKLADMLIAAIAERGGFRK